jgi:stage V sporulation protein S
MGVQFDNDEGASNEVILRVKSSSSAASVASAVSHAVYDGKRVTLRAIGAGAVNQAVKAIAIANSFVAPRGIVLDTRPGFTTVNTPDAGEISAILLRILVH